MRPFATLAASSRLALGGVNHREAASSHRRAPGHPQIIDDPEVRRARSPHDAEHRAAADTLTGHPRRAEAGRRPLRLRALEGAPRGARRARRATARRVMGTSHRQKPVKALVGEIRAGLRELFGAARRLRGRARQRRRDRLLGRGRVRPGPRALAAPGLRRVLAEVRRPSAKGAPFLAEPVVDRRRARRRRPTRRRRIAGRRGRRRRRRVGAQRDLDRRDGAGRAARPAPATRWSLIDATSGAGGLPVDVGAGRRLLLRAAEELRLRRRPVAGAAQPRRAGADRRARTPPSAGSRRSSRCRRRSRTRSRTRPTTRRPSRRCSCSPTRSTGCSTSAASTGASARTRRVLRGSSTAGRERSGYATPFVAEPAKRSLVVGTIDFDEASTPPRSPRRCAPTASSTPSPTASSGATSCAIGMFPAVEPGDVQALTACIDWIVERSRR